MGGMISLDSVAKRLDDVRKRIEAAALRVGRDPSSVRLMAVSKKMPPSLIAAAFDAGQLLFGENYVQEAKRKMEDLQGLRGATEWHLIGHLQKNKVRHAVSLFDCIQTVDSMELAAAIDRRAGQEGKRIRTLVQVNIGREQTKAGIDPAVAPDFVKRIMDFEYIDVEGLMTIHPYNPDPEESRPWFRMLSDLFNQIRREVGSSLFRHLSMGMSGDFEVAVEEGATIVRVGTAIFGERKG